MSKKSMVGEYKPNVIVTKTVKSLQHFFLILKNMEQLQI